MSRPRLRLIAAAALFSLVMAAQPAAAATMTRLFVGTLSFDSADSTFSGEIGGLEITGEQTSEVFFGDDVLRDIVGATATLSSFFLTNISSEPLEFELLFIITPVGTLLPGSYELLFELGGTGNGSDVKGFGFVSFDDGGTFAQYTPLHTAGDGPFIFVSRVITHTLLASPLMLQGVITGTIAAGGSLFLGDSLVLGIRQVSVPEPAAVGLLLMGGAALAARSVRRRRRR